MKGYNPGYIPVRIAPMLAKKTVTVKVTVPDARLVTMRLKLSRVLFWLAGHVGGFRSVEIDIR